MNPHEYPVAAAININSWKNNMNIDDKFLINGVGEFKGDEKEVIFYSVEAKRYYNVSVCASSNIGKFVNIIVTAQTGRKNIISRMVGAIADAFKRLNTSGMKFSKTRSYQIKNKLENDILNQAIANGNKHNADKKTIENGFKAATQLNNKFDIDDIDNETRFILAKSYHEKHHDPSLLQQLQGELNARMRRLQQEAASLSASVSFFRDEMVFNGVDGALNLTDYALTGNNNARQRIDDARDRVHYNLWRQNHYNCKLDKIHHTIRLVSGMLSNIQNAIDSKSSRI